MVEKGPDPDPYLWLTDPDPGGLKTYGSGSTTLATTISLLLLIWGCVCIARYNSLKFVLFYCFKVFTKIGPYYAICIRACYVHFCDTVQHPTYMQERGLYLVPILVLTVVELCNICMNIEERPIGIQWPGTNLPCLPLGLIPPSGLVLSPSSGPDNFNSLLLLLPGGLFLTCQVFRICIHFCRFGSRSGSRQSWCLQRKISE
jgi:hypothetical protein